MKTPARNKKCYLVMNDTDGFNASPDLFTMKGALKFIKDFPDRYKQQGYYRNNRMEKMDPKDVILTIKQITP